MVSFSRILETATVSKAIADVTIDRSEDSVLIKPKNTRITRFYWSILVSCAMIDQ